MDRLTTATQQSHQRFVKYKDFRNPVLCIFVKEKYCFQPFNDETVSVWRVKVKNQLDATKYAVLLPQHVSGTNVPIIRNTMNK
jgi:hypothetical protein